MAEHAGAPELGSPLDEPRLRAAFRQASPFPHFVVEDFLEPGFAGEVAAAYPSLEQARGLGREFSGRNERGKIQVSRPACFPAPVRRLHELLSSPEFCAALSRICGIPDLLADPQLEGGGMHLMGRGSRLDVHVDFNVLAERGLFRRLNILLFLNEGWGADWGGEIELWDDRVRHCVVARAPSLNRLLVFETGSASYHGVAKLSCPASRVRKSFAGYYYTVAPPADWAGQVHDTRFRARPGERIRAGVQRLESALRAARPLLGKLKPRVRRRPVPRQPGEKRD